MKRLIPLTLAALCLLSSVFVYADNVGQSPDNPRNGNNRGASSDGDKDRDFSFSNLLKSTLPTPEEKPFTKPELSTLGNWIEFRNNKAWGNEKFLVSEDSLSVGKDAIVRYAAAIPLRDGKTFNHVYEGIDCDTGQFRTYAFAGADGKWSEMNRPWDKIKVEGYNALQAPLYEMFCSARDPVSIKEMKEELGTKIAFPACPGCHSNGGGGQ
ncbi:hypothetical protein JCM19000A_17320 [Silvimonas sp. JCM 19000]